MSYTDTENLDPIEQDSEITEFEDPNELPEDPDFNEEKPQETKKKITRPIKLKMILAFGVVLSIALSIFLYYSLQLFFTDKQNYIFESGLNHVQFIKTTTEEKVSDFSQKISVFSYLSEKYPEEMKKIVNSQNDLMAFYTLTDKLVILNTFTNKQMPAEDIEKLRAPQLAENFPSLTAVEPGKFFLIPAKKLSSRASVIMGIKNPKSQKIFVGVIDFTSTISLAKKNEIFNTDIQSIDGIDYSSGKKNKNTVFKKVVKNRFNTGTILEGEKKNQLFVSYVKMPDLNMAIIATIPKSVAFQAAYDLIRKTIGYGLILLGFAFAIAVLLSLNITRPLQRLVDQTELVSQGEFGQVELVESSDEIGVLGHSISKMSQQILTLLDQKQEIIDELVVAKGELQKYSENLEDLVEKRTEELKQSNNFIQAIINSLDEGLFVIDADGKCSNTFTTACERLFEKSPRSRTFQDLLRYDQDSEDEEVLLKWLEMIYDAKLDFKSLKSLGPKGMDFITEDGQPRSLKFSYFPMYDDFDDIKNVTVVATDITAEKAAQKNFERKESEVDMILKILASRKNFINFLDASKHMIAELHQELEKNVIDLEKVKMSLHTMKGSFGTFSVLPIHDYCHDFESDIASVQKDYQFRNEWVEFLTPRVQKLQEEFDIFCGVASKIVGFDVNRENTYQRISNERLEEFAKHIRGTGNLKLYSKFRYEFVYSRLSEHFRPYYDLTFELAGRLGKKMKPLKFTNTTIRIDEFQYRGFLASLIHIFRNIMDHAIEMPHDRLAMKKDEEGLITIDPRIVERKGLPYFRLSITDDGRGIDPSMIRERVKQKQLNIPHEEMTDEEMLYVIFSSEFSSKDVITELSGRGVGLSAVKDEVSKLGGEIEIKTKLLVGTTFIFYLPYKIIEPLNKEEKA
jgi:two-component system chemotaxis sensor kinase CheA